MNTAVFCDFDGTIARRDIGYNLFHHFSGGRNDELLPDWKSGRMSSREILLREAAMVKAAPEEVYAFLDQFELNPGFPQFVQKCRESELDLQVLSDGMGFYIEYLLEKNNLTDLTVVSNQGILENGGITIQFPHDNPTCDRCGNCKGDRIREYRQAHEKGLQAIFIGDGYSDACATTAADLIFAKKDLEEYCRTNDIDYVKYDDFFDVSRHLVERGYLVE